jgi:alkylated DNA repair dioxygenase AlkB
MEIKTDKSFLKLDKFNDTDLIKECVKNIIDNLQEYPEIKIFGKICRQRRCVGFFSDKSKGYNYSNQILLAKPMTDQLTILLNIVNKMYNTDFNGILVNRYKSGLDYISAHSDDETGLDNNGVIAISYGAKRILRIRDKKTKKIIKDILLESYSIIQMGGDFQKEFTHEIPIQKKVLDERISFTFRKHNK